MEIEIIFVQSSTPKKIKNVYAVYTKDALLCVQLEEGLIIKYPLIHIFSICHQHGNHLGSSSRKEEAKT
jgi:hypothetical protein